MLQLLSRFSEAFRALETLSLLKVKKLQAPPGKLIRPEADGSDLCVADSS